jgi:hypothetical protein
MPDGGFKIWYSGFRQRSVELINLFWVLRKVPECSFEVLKLRCQLSIVRPCLMRRRPFVLDFLRNDKMRAISRLVELRKLEQWELICE